MHARLWYCQPIDLVLLNGHVNVIHAIHEFDHEQKLACYTDWHPTYLCSKANLKRRGHTHILEYLKEVFRERLVPYFVPRMGREPGRLAGTHATAPSSCLVPTRTGNSSVGTWSRSKPKHELP